MDESPAILFRVQISRSLTHIPVHSHLRAQFNLLKKDNGGNGEMKMTTVDNFTSLEQAVNELQKLSQVFWVAEGHSRKTKRDVLSTAAYLLLAAVKVGRLGLNEESDDLTRMSIARMVYTALNRYGVKITHRNRRISHLWPTPMQVGVHTHAHQDYLLENFPSLGTPFHWDLLKIEEVETALERFSEPFTRTPVEDLNMEGQTKASIEKLLVLAIIILNTFLIEGQYESQTDIYVAMVNEGLGRFGIHAQV